MSKEEAIVHDELFKECGSGKAGARLANDHILDALPEDDVYDAALHHRLGEAGVDLLPDEDDPGDVGDVAYDDKVRIIMRAARVGFEALQQQVREKNNELGSDGVVALCQYGARVGDRRSPRVAFMQWQRHQELTRPARFLFAQPVPIDVVTGKLGYAMHKDEPYRQQEDILVISPNCHAIVFKHRGFRECVPDIYIYIYAPL